MKKKAEKKEELKLRISKKTVLIAVIIILVVIAGYLVLYNQNTKQGDVTFVNIIKNYIGISQKTAKQGDTVLVNYIGKINNTVFDTNIEKIATEEGLFTSSRTYAPIGITIGAGKFLKGFEDALYGMKEGETKTVAIPPGLAYGDYDPKNIVSVPKSKINNSEQIKVGTVLTDQNGRIVRVVAVNETDFVVDLNHPLAGKTLTFIITLVKIEKNA